MALDDSPQRTSGSMRRTDLDWLRILAVLLLVPFHSALIFVLAPHSIMYVKDAINSEFMDRMAGAIHQFHMPLLFLISGASTWFALQRRSMKGYLRERISRLLVPAIFTIVVLLPPMTYITQLINGKAHGFGQHFLNFFIFNPSDLTGYSGNLTPAHVWFILFLFVFSVIALPLFWLERREKNHRISIRIARFFEKPFALFLWVIPLALTASLDILGDKNPLYYFTTFCLGYLLMTSPGYQKAIDRLTWTALVLGVIFEILRQTWSPGFQEWSLAWIGHGIMEQSIRWLFVLALLGLGRRFLTGSGKLLSYLSEAAFPFYLLHLPVNTLVGYFVIQLEAAIAVKYLVIVTLTTLITFGFYELARRVSPLRFLLGMKSRSTEKKVAPLPAGS